MNTGPLGRANVGGLAWPTVQAIMWRPNECPEQSSDHNFHTGHDFSGHV